MNATQDNSNKANRPLAATQNMWALNPIKTGASMPALQINVLDHIQLAMPVGQEDAARAFYRDLLGMNEVPKPAPLVPRGGAWFNGPGIGVHLGVEKEFQPARKAHPCFRVADLDSAWDALQAAGVPLTPDDSLPDVRRFYAADPFGNRIEFMQDYK
jgi:catechol 2,3-dioxygenase-like lactoylglutathione lyase family enzyme